MKMLKMAFLGDSNVGKTSILKKYKNNEFLENTNCTVGFDFIEKYVQHNGKNIKLFIYDTAGNEKYKSSFIKCLSDTKIIFFVYAKNE
jgi:small GTP-binding protein